MNPRKGIYPVGPRKGAETNFQLRGTKAPGGNSPGLKRLRGSQSLVIERDRDGRENSVTRGLERAKRRAEGHGGGGKRWVAVAA